MSENMFEKATRIKLRYSTCKGDISVEDLWEIPLVANGLSLDRIAINLNKRAKENIGESFVTKKSEADKELVFAFDIVKHIIKVRLTEAENNEKKVINDARRKKILELIADKAVLSTTILAQENRLNSYADLSERKEMDKLEESLLESKKLCDVLSSDIAARDKTILGLENKNERLEKEVTEERELAKEFNTKL